MSMATEAHRKGAKDAKRDGVYPVPLRVLCAFAVSLCGILLVQGCGYRVASKNRVLPEVRTLAVAPLVNETTTFEVEQILTRSLVQAFIEKSSFEITNSPSDADAVLKGTVTMLNATPVIFGGGFGSTFLVTLNARVELQDRRTGKVLFRNDSYTFREQYIINVDVKNFFSELNPALDRIAHDFASSVVTTILEGY